MSDSYNCGSCGHQATCYDDNPNGSCEHYKRLKKAQWNYTEFDEPLGYGGMLKRRGYKCSACGGFRSMRQGKSAYCEFCGADTREAENDIQR